MVKFIVHLVGFLLFIFALPAPVQAQPSGYYFMNAKNVRVCAVDTSANTRPDFEASDCQTQSLGDIKPMNKTLWIKGTLSLPDIRGPKGEPLSLYVAGAMASEVYINGEFIGRNGMPGTNAETEVAGHMDAQFFPPQTLLRVGDNDIILKVSSFHNILGLNRPFHTVLMAPSGIHANGSLSRYIPALVTLGLFLVSGVYFGIMGVIGQTKIRFWTLSAMCFFAAAQLTSEALRGLIAYDYPIHALRLIGITVFSAGFGFSVAFHVFRSFVAKSAIWIMLGVSFITLVVMIIIPGYDYKAMAGLLLPMTIGLCAAGWWSYKRRPRAFVFFLTILMFVGALLLFQGLFLDSVFFFLVAFLLLILFVEQAFLLASEAKQRKLEEARAEQLQMALAEAGERTAAREITIKSAGSIERLSTNTIMHCTGAGGYSEITLSSGRVVLHSATLNELEETLPATFLRVHRSHLINVMFLKTLKRDPSGTGMLTLSENIQVPVSRRIMPKVREKLT